jgi:hypothetical protein
MFGIGLGLGQLLQTLTVASQNSVSSRDMGVATSTSTFFRSMGGTAGTAILFSVLFSRLPETLKAAFANPASQNNIEAALQDPAVLADPNNAAIIEILENGQTNSASLVDSLNGNSAFLTNVDPRLAEPFLVGFADATVTVYWIAFAVAAAAFVLSWFMRTQPLREKSAMQEAADAAVQAEQAAEAMGSMVDPGVAMTPAELAAAEAREAKRRKARAKK